jgi:putative zinc finger/helix-turn-helix YgiT family protein
MKTEERKGAVTMTGICPRCEKETSLVRVDQDEEIVVRGDPIKTRVIYDRCQECGAEFHSPDAPQDPLDAAYRLYREQHGMAQPEEIREFRQRVGLTQRELAGLLGWGEATLSRYENGALQDEAHDTALRLAMEPDNLVALVRAKPDVLSQQRQRSVFQAIDESEEWGCGSLTALYESGFGADVLDEFSGYRSLDIAKLFNAILFFCRDADVPKTKLNKLLFYADFKHFKQQTVSITGSRYAHLPYGPAPDNYHHYIAALHHNEGLLRIVEVDFGDYSGEYLTALEEPDLSVFSTSEITTLASVKERFADMKASAISKLSHEEEGFRQTSDGDLISYEYARSLSI